MRNDRHLTLLAALGLCLALPILGQEPATGAEGGAGAEDSARAAVVEIFEKADAAARKVRSVRFKGHSKPTGIVTNFVGSAEGEGFMEGWDELTNRPQKFWARVEATAPGSEQARQLTGGGDGDSYFLVDHQTKKGYEDIDPGVLGTGGQTLSTIGLAQFVHPTPYQRELDAEQLELLGKEEVGGVECYRIKVKYAGGGGGAETGSIWSIGTADFLPRGRVRQFSVPQQGDGELEIVLTELELDADAEPDLFKMKLPEGYEQIDDFAP